MDVAALRAGVEEGVGIVEEAQADVRRALDTVDRAIARWQRVSDNQKLVDAVTRLQNSKQALEQFVNVESVGAIDQAHIYTAGL